MGAARLLEEWKLNLVQEHSEESRRRLVRHLAAVSGSADARIVIRRLWARQARPTLLESDAQTTLWRTVAQLVYER